MPEDAPVNRGRRLWLIQRIAWARRSLDLLDRKKGILLGEHARMANLCAATATSWEATARAARSAAVRASAMGGAADHSLMESGARPASVEFRWKEVVGVRYPSEVRVDLSPPEPARRAAVSDSVSGSADAHRRAIGAAAEYALAQRAYRIVDRELQSTQRRHRAVEDHRLPALESELHRLELRLDELELQQQITVRWASRRRPASGGVQSVDRPEDP